MDIRRHSVVAITAICVTVAASCIPATAPVRPATIEELRGPWRPTPLLLDPVMRDRADAACRSDMQMPPQAQPVLIDARGASVVTLRYGGPNVAGDCDALEITASGDFVGAGGGMSGQGEAAPGIADTQLGPFEVHAVGGGSLEAQGHSVVGRVGRGIARVVIEAAGLPEITATVENGWFGAWWPRQPGDPDPLGPMGPRPSLFRVSAYDLGGRLVDETRGP